MVESILFIVTEINASSLLSLSENYTKTDMVSIPIFQTLGATLQESRAWGFEIGMLFFCLAAFLFYYSFYKSRFIPLFLSVWGIIGATTACIATMLRLDEIDIYGLEIALNLPIATNEIVLSFWLILKGFTLPNISTEHQ